LWIRVQAYVNVAVRLSLEAIDGAADSHAAIFEVKPAWDVHASQRRSPLALSYLEVKFQERDLNPVVAGDAKNNDRHAQRHSSSGPEHPPRESLHEVTSVCRSTDLTVSKAYGWGGIQTAWLRRAESRRERRARVLYWRGSAVLGLLLQNDATRERHIVPGQAPKDTLHPLVSKLPIRATVEMQDRDFHWLSSERDGRAVAPL
jgi:hypothetical protein